MNDFSIVGTVFGKLKVLSNEKDGEKELRIVFCLKTIDGNNRLYQCTTMPSLFKQGYFMLRNENLVKVDGFISSNYFDYQGDYPPKDIKAILIATQIMLLSKNHTEEKEYKSLLESYPQLAEIVNEEEKND